MNAYEELGERLDERLVKHGGQMLKAGEHLKERNEVTLKEVFLTILEALYELGHGQLGDKMESDLIDVMDALDNGELIMPEQEDLF